MFAVRPVVRLGPEELHLFANIVFAPARKWLTLTADAETVNCFACSSLPVLCYF